jgi:hypothetical protein
MAGRAIFMARRAILLSRNSWSLSVDCVAKLSLRLVLQPQRCPRKANASLDIAYAATLPRGAALNQISNETEQRPLVAVAIALGVGILIGMAMHRRD